MDSLALPLFDFYRVQLWQLKKKQVIFFANFIFCWFNEKNEIHFNPSDWRNERDYIYVLFGMNFHYRKPFFCCCRMKWTIWNSSVVSSVNAAHYSVADRDRKNTLFLFCRRNRMTFQPSTMTNRRVNKPARMPSDKLIYQEKGNDKKSISERLSDCRHTEAKLFFFIVTW